MLIFSLNSYFTLFLLLDTLLAGAETNSKLRIDARFLQCSEQPNCENRDKSILSLDILNNDAITSGNKPDFKGPYVLEKCLRKLYISVEINNEEKVSGDDEYVLIDEVTDPVTNKLVPLLNPVVLKMRREQPQLVYPLVFQQVVNGGAYEESFNAGNDSATSTCDQSLCGVTQYNGKSLPFSEGFCCSCRNPRVDKLAPSYSNQISLKEPELLTHFSAKRSPSLEKPQKRFGSPASKPKSDRACSKKTKSKCRKHPPNFFFENDEIIVGKSNDRLRSIGKTSSPHNYSHKGQVYFKPGKEKQREIRGLKNSSNLRKRVDQQRLKRVSNLKQNRRHLQSKSRQACDNEKDANSSVHCLKLSNLWYTVYRFQTPVVIQEISLQAFQKKVDANGDEYWVDLTRSQVIKLGTFYPQATDELPTISFSYSSELDPSGEVGKDMSPIDIESSLLLVPTHVEKSTATENYAQAEGGPSEFMVVSKSDVSTDGRGCDRIGVLFEGFSRQNRRCQRPEGSCLNHQPLDLWLADMEKRVRGERGQYFVENFGQVADAVLASSIEIVKKDYLALYFEKPFQSLIEVELGADTNALIRKGGSVEIQSITADSSGTHRSVIEVLVVNTDLAPGYFRPRLVECNEDLPPDCVPEGPSVLIPPLQRHLFRIVIEGSVPAAEMTCTVEVYNVDGERTASRAVLIKKLDRCLCAYHCSCSCLQDNFACSVLMEEEYAAAGYKEILVTRKILTDAPAPLAAVYLVAVMVLFLLLLLGKFKILFGWRIWRVKMFGINFIMEHLHPRFQDCTEKSLFQRGLYFFLNWFFFPVYFLMIFWLCILKLGAWGCCFLFRAKRQLPASTNWENSDQDYTYELEADDERFVLDTMDTLQLVPTKRSQSSHSM